MTVFTTGKVNRRRYLFIVTLILILLSVWFRIVNHGWKKVVERDGKGYYAYLPSVISYRDLTFKHYSDTSKFDKDYKDNFLYTIDGSLVIKYPAGVAVMLSPFYLTAEIITHIAGFSTGGYSFFYMLFVCLAAIFYALAGCYFIIKLLKIFCIPDFIAYLFVTTLIFGTNMLVYIIKEPSMSHVYSFCVAAGFILYTKQFYLFRKSSDFYIASLCMGLIILIRPVNGLILFSAFLLFENAAQLQGFLVKLISNYRRLLIGVIIFLSLLLIQPVLWYLQNGHFLVWTYLDETFNWTHPEIKRVLFSYRKGWWVYTPFCLIIIPGIIREFSRLNIYKTIVNVLFWSLVIYVISSWWCWYYGGSFGQRAFIEYYPVIAVTCSGLFLSISTSGIARSVLVIFSIGCILLNIIQSYQYKYNILHYDSMTRSKYWDVFLQTGKEYERKVFFNPILDPPQRIKDRIILKSHTDFEELGLRDWTPVFHDIDFNALSGNHVAKFGNDKAYGPMYKSPVNFTGEASVYVKGHFALQESFIGSELMVALNDSTGETYHRQSYTLNDIVKPIPDFPDWCMFEADTKFHKVKPGSVLVIYVYSPQVKVILDDLVFFVYN